MGVRRFFYDIRFVTRNAMRIEHNVDIDPMSVVMTNNLGHATPSKADHITTGMISGLEDKWNEQNGFGMQISSEYPCLYQSISPVHSSKSKFEENSLVNSQHQLSMESQNLNIFNSTTCGDATISSALTALPYYTDASVLNYRHSSLLECTLHNSIFPCLENESLSSYMESKCTSRSGIISSGLSANVPNVLSRCPVPYQYSDRAGMPFPGPKYSKNMVRVSYEYEGSKGFSVPNPSSDPFLLSESGNNERTGKGASFSYNSSMLDCRCPVASQDKHEHKLMHVENNEAFADCHEDKLMDLDICPYSENMYSVCQKKKVSVFSRLALPPKICEQGNGNQIQHDECSTDSSVDKLCELLHFENNEAFVGDVPVLKKGKSRSIDYEDDSSMQLSEKMYSVCQKKRKSVFSRLSFAPKVCEQGNGTPVQHHECDMDSSMDEVMTMLNQSHCKWVRREKCFKQMTSDLTKKIRRNVDSSWRRGPNRRTDTFCGFQTSQ
ncbi:hypothetical protein P3X46_020048 [Hevea brasiliensis]|uniref:Uncharacterized protein n=1 Tax=Hevea brasiliensis TaxID=3981 RepID=A0ABQ9LKP2_HEVBR|nr:uncharacterized protein LOC110672353 [Hevea brasiliensis]KAJ9168541.1 hypothetical protein P3X46_020048 [Hevea brasiliensis]